MNNNGTTENRKSKYEGSQTINEVFLIWIKQASSMNTPNNCTVLLPPPTKNIFFFSQKITGNI
jgi:hypothetical protein